MKLVFSEAPPDYARYAFPYVVWGFPEAGETPADFFTAGFLPSSPQLDRFYLCRQLRVGLRAWQPTSENRRILRKGGAIHCQLVPRADFEYHANRRAAWLDFAHERFGAGVMPGERLDRLMGAPVVSHLLHFQAAASGAELGTVLLYLQPARVAYYYFAFYDRSQRDNQLGMYLMTRAAEFFSQQGYAHLHLGTCYHERALYKTQFSGVEYFTGWRWSSDLNALKSLVRHAPVTGHLLEDPDHPAGSGGKPARSAAETCLRLPTAPPTPDAGTVDRTIINAAPAIAGSTPPVFGLNPLE